MKTPSIRITILSLIFAPILSAQDAQESAPQAPPAASPAVTPTGATVAKPEVVSKEALQLVGFPMAAFQYEPALTAALQLTPEQQQELKTAMEETLDQTKKDMAGNEDKKQTMKNMERARKDFESRRGSILGEQQITLINTMRATLRNAQSKSKNVKFAPGEKNVAIKDLFLKELKSSLNVDQVALIEAAGGKLP